MPCDFCHNPKPTKLFPAKDFSVTEGVSNEWHSVAEWAACDPCVALIESDNYDALLNRAMKLNPSMQGERENPALFQLIKAAYAQFRAARTGPAVPWTAE